MKTMKALYRFFIISALLTTALSACNGQTATPTSAPTQTLPAPTATATTAPAQIPSPIIARPTEQPFYIAATVWPGDPIVPVLTYHQFQGGGISDATHTRIVDFKKQLESLYQAGYVMIPLANWLNGDLRVPLGKRPIIFTMDDLFYRNQIRFKPDGTIDPMTGLGASYEFSQAHPDFGFSWALFASLGDKPYIDDKNPMILANAIVWCMDHGALIYNHTYSHALLSKTSYSGVTWELAANDERLMQLLTLAKRQDLIAKLGNILALPYGIWPRGAAAENSLVHYKNLLGAEIQAIMNIDFIYRPRYMEAPYSRKFNRMDLPRIVATVDAVEYFAKNADKVPKAQACKLGPLDQTMSGDANYLAGQINQAVHNGVCPSGIYATDQFIFRADGLTVKLIFTVKH